MAQLMKRLLALLFLSYTALHAQFGPQIDYVLPDTGGTTPGEICFVDTNDYPGTLDTACIKAPSDITTSYDLTLPAALPGAQSCVEVSTGGVISFTGSACGSAGGSPGGVDRDVQINDSSAFGPAFTSPTRLYTQDFAGFPFLTFESQGTSAGSTFEAKVASGSGANFGLELRSVSTRGTLASPSATASGDLFFRMSGYGHDGTSEVVDRIWYRQVADGTFTGSSQPTRHEFWTVASGSTTLTERWRIEDNGALIPGSDSAYDIGIGGVSPTRVDQVFADYLNAQTFEVENAGGTAHFTLELGASGMDIDNTSGTRQLRFTGSSISSAVSILADTDSALDIGENATRFRDIYADDLDANILRMANTGHNLFYIWEHSGTDLVLDDTSGTELIRFGSGTQPKIDFTADMGPVSGGSADIGTFSLYFGEIWGGTVTARTNLAVRDSTNSFNVVNISSGSNDGSAAYRGSSGNIGANIGVSDFVGCTNCGFLSVSNASASIKAQMAVDSGGDGYISLSDSTDTDTVVLSANGTTPDLVIELNTGGNVLPDTASNHDLGGSGAEWDNIYGNWFQIRSAAGTCRLYTGSGAPGGACTHCDMVLRTDGGAGTTLYVCEAGTWAAK